MWSGRGKKSRANWGENGAALSRSLEQATQDDFNIVIRVIDSAMG